MGSAKRPRAILWKRGARRKGSVSLIPQHIHVNKGGDTNPGLLCCSFAQTPTQKNPPLIAALTGAMAGARLWCVWPGGQAGWRNGKAPSWPFPVGPGLLSGAASSGSLTPPLLPPVWQTRERRRSDPPTPLLPLRLRKRIPGCCRQAGRSVRGAERPSGTSERGEVFFFPLARS